MDDKKPAAAAAGAFDLKMINPSTFQVEAIEYELRANSKNPDDTITTTTTNNPNSADKIIKNNIASTINPPKQKSGSQFQIESPFISQLSRHIVQKKKECIELARYNKALEKDTKILELKRKQIEFEFDLTKQEEKYVMRYIDWFYDLKRELWERYSIKIDDDFEKFTSVINDFKKNGFDASKIMEKYISAISLDDKIKKENDELKILYSQKLELNKNLSYLQDQTYQHKQTMDIYYQLENRNLRLKELKQLYNTILEIAEANKISHQEAVSKFLDDIEKEYDNKLGFESKVKEKKEEIDQLNNKINNIRLMFRLEPSIGPTISNLFQKGIGEQDIIGINQLVDICTKNNTDLGNYSYSIGPQNENSSSSSSSSSSIIKDNRKENTTNNHNKITSNRSEYWKLLTDELKKYGGIKLAMKVQQEKHDLLQKEVVDLDKQKQDLANYLQIAISVINTINQRILYCKGFLDRNTNINNNKINLSSQFSMPLPIFILYDNTGKGKNDNG